MKKIVSTLCIVLVTFSLFSQTEIKLSIAEFGSGRNLLTDQDIFSKQYIFPQKIYEVYPRATGKNLIVQLRNTRKNKETFKSMGYVTLLNPEEGTIRWSKKIDYRNTSFRQHQDIIIQTLDAGWMSKLDTENGNPTWKTKNSLYFVDPTINTGIGYTFNSFSGYTDKLQGVDLTTGKTLWERELLHPFGWNDVIKLNDTTIMIASSGLHTVNIHTGKGWDYFMETGDKDYTAMIATNAAGLALGILTGSFVVSTGPDIVREIVSNVLIDSVYIYFASRDKIVCLNHMGEAQWSTTFGKDMASKSTIYKDDGKIYMINNGFAFTGYRKINYGTPFIAAFDSHTGNKIFKNIIGGKKELIKGFKTNRDTIYLITNNAISKYSLTDGSCILEKTMDNNTGEPLYYIGNHVYIQSELPYMSLPLSGPDFHYVYTSLGKIQVLNANFDLLGEVPEIQLYIHYLTHDGYRFISKDEQTLILDDQGRAIAEIPGSDESFILDSKFYSIRDNILLETSLNDLISN